MKALADELTKLLSKQERNKYKCPHCGKIVLRESDKKWIS